MLDFNSVKLNRKPKKIAIDRAEELKNSAFGHKVMAINILEKFIKIKIKLKIIKSKNYEIKWIKIKKLENMK